MENEEIINVLDKIKIPTNTHRRQASNNQGCKSMTFGLTGLNKKTWISKQNEKFPDAYQKLTELACKLDPDFKYTSITLNKNFKTSPHIDKNNTGVSMIVGLGDYTGGGLFIKKEDESITLYDIKNKPCYFEGHKLTHWTEDFQGTRYTAVYFTRKWPLSV